MDCRIEKEDKAGEEDPCDIGQLVQFTVIPMKVVCLSLYLILIFISRNHKA